MPARALTFQPTVAEKKKSCDTYTGCPGPGATVRVSLTRTISHSSTQELQPVQLRPISFIRVSCWLPHSRAFWQYALICTRNVVTPQTPTAQKAEGPSDTACWREQLNPEGSRFRNCNLHL